YECETCEREFVSQHAANQHMDALSHWAPRFECETCDREFDTQRSANQHTDDSKHWTPQFECETCDRRFHSQNAATQHMNDKGHWAPQIKCEICDRRFHNQNSANQHMDALNHWKSKYCGACDRGFTNENNLEMHLSSSIHRGTQVQCHFCKGPFTSASGLSHLESASCSRANNLNREKIYRAIRNRDSGGIITMEIIEYPEFETQNIATGATWNGFSYECYLCHREFDTVRQLNQHLGSPAHSQKLYHCSNGKCGSEFVSLAALFNHLESESCNLVRFEKVQQ
ncbi:hypothetical protein EJ05DRAFT_422990, partial [Pseudovirgaria hyperparasitica]